MSKENRIITDFDFKLIANYFKGLDRQGPGGDEQTLRALDFVRDMLPQHATIADLGCGTGRQTAVLAKAMPRCTVSALDLLPEMIEGLRERIAREGLGGRVEAVQASMDEMPYRSGQFDMIWSEGAIYNIGFERGLTQWRKYLKPDGIVAVTECSYLSTQRPDDNDTWLTDNFVEIGQISDKLRVMEQAGYMPLAHFVLPERCWTENYYAPMGERTKRFLAEHDNSASARWFVERLDEEIAYYRKNGRYYGYVFYIGQKMK